MVDNKFMREKLKTGSPFLFGLIRLFNFVYGAMALGLFALSIWLWSQFNAFSAIEIIFMLLSLFEMFLVVLACTSKKSTGRLRLYLLLITIVFVAEFTAAIVVFATGDKIIDELVNKVQAEQEWNRLKDYLLIVNYYVIGTIVLEFLLAVMVKCYIGSLREKNSEFDYKAVDDEGNKMSLQEKRDTDNAKIQEKYAKKREEMKQKYGYN